MSNATQDPASAILDRISKLDDRLEKLTPIEGLLKSLQGPASKAGMTPIQLIERMTQGGTRPLAFGSDGASMFDVSDDIQPFAKPKILGDRFDRSTGKTFNFGAWLKAIHAHRSPGGDRNEQILKALGDFGTQRVITDTEDGVFRKAALAESSGTTGGYAVPIMFSNQLLRMAWEESIVLPLAHKQPLTSRTMQIPSLDITTSYGAGQSPFVGGIVGSWSPEAATIAESEPQLRQTTLTAWQFSFYALASNTLLADNAVGLDAVLTSLFSGAIAWGTDYAFLQGNGVGKPMGILNAPATILVGRNQTSYFNWADVTQMLASLYWAGRNPSSIRWIVSQAAIGNLFRLNDMSGSQTNTGFGRLVFQPIDQGAQAPVDQSEGLRSFGRLGGFPVLVTEKVPALGTKGDIMLVDLSQYVVAPRMELEIDVSPHIKFFNNQMAFRVIWRGDGQPWLNQAITIGDGATKVSPYIALNT